jgi:hypothetical protein
VVLKKSENLSKSLVPGTTGSFEFITCHRYFEIFPKPETSSYFTTKKTHKPRGL